MNSGLSSFTNNPCRWQTRNSWIEVGDCFGLVILSKSPRSGRFRQAILKRSTTCGCNSDLGSMGVHRSRKQLRKHFEFPQQTFIEISKCLPCNCNFVSAESMILFGTAQYHSHPQPARSGSVWCRLMGSPMGRTCSRAKDFGELQGLQCSCDMFSSCNLKVLLNSRLRTFVSGLLNFWEVQRMRLRTNWMLIKCCFHPSQLMMWPLGFFAKARHII